MSRLEEIRKRLQGQISVKKNGVESCEIDRENIKQEAMRNLTSYRKELGNSRKALIIGNSSYYYPQSHLNGCRPDAEAMSKFFKAIGYIVTCILDANLDSMEQAYIDFEHRINDGDEAVLYFSGHGVQVNSEQYLLPIDFNASCTEEIILGSINLQKKIDQIMNRGARMTLAIVDACRQQIRFDLADNLIIPEQIYSKNIDSNTKKSRVNNVLSKDAKSGLNEESQCSSNNSSRKGIGIVYASSHNTSSVDSSFLNHGIFTSVFLQEAIVPGRSISEVVHIVRKKVMQQSKMETSLQSNGRLDFTQAPAFYDSLDGDFYFIPPDAI